MTGSPFGQRLALVAWMYGALLIGAALFLPVAAYMPDTGQAIGADRLKAAAPWVLRCGAAIVVWCGAIIARRKALHSVAPLGLTCAGLFGLVAGSVLGGVVADNWGPAINEAFVSHGLPPDAGLDDMPIPFFYAGYGVGIFLLSFVGTPSGLGSTSALSERAVEQMDAADERRCARMDAARS